MTIAALCFARPGVLASARASPGTLYSNGPSNFETGAYPINFEAAISDSFTIAANSTATSATFVAWGISGDMLSSVDWSVGSNPFCRHRRDSDHGWHVDWN